MSGRGRGQGEKRQGRMKTRVSHAEPARTQGFRQRLFWAAER